MVRHTEEHRIKSDAFSLSKALATYKVKLSHQQCLDVLARMGGHKNFEVMASSGSGSTAVSESYEESALRMFGAMRARVEEWLRSRPTQHATPGVLMADAYAVGANLGAKAHKYLAKENASECVVSLLCEGSAIEMFVAHDQEEDLPRVDVNQWKAVEVRVRAHLGEADRGRQGHDRVALRLYEKYLEQVEALAKGYATCMEMFMDNVQYLKSEGRDWTVEWRFYEADPSSNGYASAHPMVRCGDHFICATGVGSGFRSDEDGVLDLVVGLWHVPVRSMTRTAGKDISEVEVCEVFARSKPHVIHVEKAGTEILSWKYLPRTVGESDPQTLKKLLEAVQLATDGAALLEGEGPHGTVNLDRARLDGGQVVVEVREDYDISSARVELTQAQTAAALLRISEGARLGLIKVVDARRGSDGNVGFTPNKAVGDGFAILLMQTGR